MSCNSCQKEGKKRKSISLLSGIFLILLPKCPFCVVAYSGTIALCGNAPSTSTISHENQTALVLSALLSMIIACAIVLNYRGWRTWMALGLALTGMLVLNGSILKSAGYLWYYSGVVITFSGVWLNGSLLYFISRSRSFTGMSRAFNYLQNFK